MAGHPHAVAAATQAPEPPLVQCHAHRHPQLRPGLIAVARRARWRTAQPWGHGQGARQQTWCHDKARCANCLGGGQQRNAPWTSAGAVMVLA